MTSDARLATPPTSGSPAARARGVPRILLDHWPLIAGLTALALPTFARLGRQVWSTEAGAHAPIVLATGVWLLVREGASMRAEARPGRELVFWPALALALALWVFGSAYDFISLEAAALWLVTLLVAYRLVGEAAVRGSFFPFLYLAFLVPPPGWVVDRLTAPLQTLISTVATDGLAALGVPISRYGVTLFVGPYQLLVEQACSGMNSIVGLTAVSLFYIHVLHRASWRYALLLAACILPVAVFTNLLRVVALVLITHWFGDAAAQGFLHVTAGVALFAVALAIIFGLDTLFQRVLGRRSEAA